MAQYEVTIYEVHKSRRIVEVAEGATDEQIIDAAMDDIETQVSLTFVELAEDWSTGLSPTEVKKIG